VEPSMLSGYPSHAGIPMEVCAGQAPTAGLVQKSRMKDPQQAEFGGIQKASPPKAKFGSCPVRAQVSFDLGGSIKTKQEPVTANSLPGYSGVPVKLCTMEPLPSVALVQKSRPKDTEDAAFGTPQKPSPPKASKFGSCPPRATVSFDLGEHDKVSKEPLTLKNLQSYGGIPLKVCTGDSPTADLAQKSHLNDTKEDACGSWRAALLNATDPSRAADNHFQRLRKLENTEPVAVNSLLNDPEEVPGDSPKAPPPAANRFVSSPAAVSSKERDASTQQGKFGFRGMMQAKLGNDTPCLVCDLSSGQVLASNPLCDEICGDLQGCSLLSLFHSDDHDAVGNCLAYLLVNSELNTLAPQVFKIRQLEGPPLDVYLAGAQLMGLWWKFSLTPCDGDGGSGSDVSS